MKNGRCFNGYALVVVLWLLALLTGITASFHASTRAEAAAFGQTFYRAQARAAAEAGIWLTAADLFASGRSSATDLADAERTLTFGDVLIDVSVLNVTGKVNLNRAQGDLIMSLLEKTALTGSERSELVEAILEWRAGAATHGSAGARSEDDHSAAEARRANGFFYTVDELRQVPGMNNAVFEQIAPLLTVHGNHARVNPYAASRDVLLALPGASELAVDMFLNERRNAQGSAQVTGFDQRFLQGGASDTYAVTAVATVGGVEARISATILHSRRSFQTVQVLAWNAVY